MLCAPSVELVCKQLYKLSKSSDRTVNGEISFIGCECKKKRLVAGCSIVH